MCIGHLRTSPFTTPKPSLKPVPSVTIASRPTLQIQASSTRKEMGNRYSIVSEIFNGTNIQTTSTIMACTNTNNDADPCVGLVSLSPDDSTSRI
ncbi:hypothetical protein CDAR_518141 [Caerostris darwini]|uniref:Uncharacterized protein n=1 Tax=Caerostris darwini TaxID=1538125 RepID=A0AAV4VHR7_9ARAC|nr:hypothetical protein CDAR_518141 [Caerostris darwini]